MTAAGDIAAPPATQRDQLERAFERAWTERPERRRTAWFVFADHAARLRVVGGELSDVLCRAFAHLRIDPPATAPGLRIDLWDEGETGVGAEGLRAESDLSARTETFASADGRIVVTARAQTRTAFDRMRRHVVGWVGRSADLTQYEVGRPLHAELLLWHKDRDVQAVHAGLVARGGDGVLFGGPGGSGKSTTALTCLESGYQYLGDDYVGLQSAPDGGFVGHSLYCSTHLEPDHLRRFPYLLPHAVPGKLPREDKCLVMLSSVRLSGLARRARIRAVALPRVVDAETSSFRRASKVEAMLRLAPSSLLLLPHGGIAADHFHKLGRFIEAVPTYWFDVGRNFADIPRRIGEILEAHS